MASHPGLDVGPDGGSAQALEDLAAFRAIPGMTVISPADPIEMALATRAILEFDGPVYMRTGRSPAPRLFGDDHTFEIGKGQILRDGDDVTIVACGVEVARALEAAELLAADGIAARVVNMPTIKPIDAELLARCAARDRRHRHGRGSQYPWRAGRRGGGSAGRDHALPDRIRRREGHVRRIRRAGRTGRSISASPRPSSPTRPGASSRARASK